MGLDITFYSRVEKIGKIGTYEEYETYFDWETTFYAYPAFVSGKDFPGWATGLTPGGVYKFEDRIGFRAGSYSGYGFWRDVLSQIGIGVSASTVWQSPDRFKKEPFFRVVCFSDCEGLIGPKHCKKLYKHFLEHKDIAEEVTNPDWFFSTYMRWLNALEVSEGDGVLEFH